MDYLVIIFCALIFILGFTTGAWLTGRYYHRKLQDALYDFDADRLMFNQWLIESVEQHKQERR